MGSQGKEYPEWAERVLMIRNVIHMIKVDWCIDLPRSFGPRATGIVFPKTNSIGWAYSADTETIWEIKVKLIHTSYVILVMLFMNVFIKNREMNNSMNPIKAKIFKQCTYTNLPKQFRVCGKWVIIKSK
jgi:hypothetical protein